MTDVPLSQNAWPVLERDELRKWVVPRTGRHLLLEDGPAGFLLAHFASWFHDRIEPLGDGEWDDWGWSARKIRGSASTWSNHASGTAVDLNASDHPQGVRYTFGPVQRARILARLEHGYGGTIRWGGTYSGTPDEMHFEIVGTSRAVLLGARRVALRARSRGLLDSSGAHLGLLRSR